MSPLFNLSPICLPLSNFCSFMHGYLETTLPPLEALNSPVQQPSSHLPSALSTTYVLVSSNQTVSEMCLSTWTSITDYSGQLGSPLWYVITPSSVCSFECLFSIYKARMQDAFKSRIEAYCNTPSRSILYVNFRLFFRHRMFTYDLQTGSTSSTTKTVPF